MRALIVMILVLIAAPAGAQPTMAVWVEDSAVLVNDFDVQISVNFDVVVTLDTNGSQSSYAEWKMTDISAGMGLVKLGASYPVGDCGFLPENCFQGEYRISFTECEAPGDRIQLARIKFADLTGVGVKDFVVTLDGFDGGNPGFIDCEDLPVVALMGGSPGGETSAGVTYPNGSLVLNPTRPLPGAAGSFGLLKVRY